MTRPGRVHQLYLLPLEHLGGELARVSSDLQEVMSCDNDLADGYNHAVDRPTIQDAGDAAPQIASYDRVHHIGGQAEYVRAKRFSVDHSHCETPATSLSFLCRIYVGNRTDRNTNLSRKHPYFAGCRFQVVRESSEIETYMGQQS